jgi:hypothetical protein
MISKDIRKALTKLFCGSWMEQVVSVLYDEERGEDEVLVFLRRYIVEVGIPSQDQLNSLADAAQNSLHASRYLVERESESESESE